MSISLLRIVHDAGTEGLEIDLHDETGRCNALEKAQLAGLVHIKWESWAGNFGMAHLTNKGRLSLDLESVPTVARC